MPNLYYIALSLYSLSISVAATRKAYTLRNK